MRLLAGAVLVTLVACSGGEPSPAADPVTTQAGPEPGGEPTGDGVSTAPTAFAGDIGRVDLDESGNRWIDGRGALLAGEPVVIRLDASPRWIVSRPSPDGASGDAWLVVDEQGAVHDVALDGRAATVTRLDATVDPAAGPPIVADGLLRSSPDPVLDDVVDPLPDSRVVSTDSASGRVTAVLVDPTDRYGHGVLGDAVEAAGIEVRVDGDTIRLPIPAPDAIEAVSPLLADVDGDGEAEVVVTLSNDSTGARLVVVSLDGSIVAESDPIGRGNRWRNLLAVAPTGPDGSIEVIDVRTPHIGGTLEFFRVEPATDGPGRLVDVARLPGYSTHEIGSRNLDLGIVSDADGDGRLDVVLPTRDRRTLHVVTRSEQAPDGVEVVGTIAFDAAVSTNVAAQARTVAGATLVGYAVGTDDGAVHLFPSRP